MNSDPVTVLQAADSRAVAGSSTEALRKQAQEDVKNLEISIRQNRQLNSADFVAATTLQSLQAQISRADTGLPTLSRYDRVNSAVGHQQNWQRRRKGKIGTQTQRFLNGFGGLVQAYSGIADIVKVTGGPYGEAGYRAFSCMFALVMNKVSKDETLISHLEEIGRYAPRLEQWQLIYTQDNRIEELVAAIDLLIVGIASQVSKYFSKTSRRFWAAFVPKEIQDYSDFDQLKATMVELTEWANLRLHANNQKLVVSNQELLNLQREARAANQELQIQLDSAHERIGAATNKLDSLEGQIEESRKRLREQDKERDRVWLERFGDSLGIDSDTIHCNLETAYELMSPFWSNSSKPSWRGAATKPITREAIEMSEAFHMWEGEQTSRVLFLGGETTAHLRSNALYSWISPTVLELARERQKNSEVVFFTCLPEPQMYDEPILDLHNIFAAVCYRVAAIHPSALRRQGLRNFGPDLAQIWAEDPEDMIRYARSLFAAVSENCEATFYVILDRLDLCRNFTDRRHAKLLTSKKLLRYLDEIVEGADRIKIIVTMSTHEIDTKKVAEFLTNEARHTVGLWDLDQIR